VKLGVARQVERGKLVAATIQIFKTGWNVEI